MDKNKIAVEVFNKLAKEYQDKFMNVDLYRDSFDFFCSHIAGKNANILELACGPGNITKYLLKMRPDFKILGIDLSENMIRLAKINNPEAEFQIMDCRDIGMIKKKYDGIMCGFCLPYLTKGEAVEMISNASKILTPGGLLYLSTMEDDYSKSGLKIGSAGDEIYMHYHQANYLTNALKENGFQISDLQRKVYSSPDGTETTDLLIIAKKQN
jgi:ubiquinone/menaquinone biosynthesis C-methylase UbiE